MRVDFYQLSRDAAHAVIPLLAANTLKAGERILVVSADEAQRVAVSQALWSHAQESFLAHGEAGGADDARQPVLLSDGVEPRNGAKFVALADGVWREGLNAFARVFLLFDDATIADARKVWRSLDGQEGVERNYWRQAEVGWEQVA